MNTLADAIAYVTGIADAAEDSGENEETAALRAVLAAAERNPLQSPEYDLVTRLMAVSARDLNYTTNALLDAYKRDAETARAKLDLIQRKVDELIGGQWMPTSHAIESALYPSDAAVKAHMQNMNEGMA